MCSSPTNTPNENTQPRKIYDRLGVEMNRRSSSLSFWSLLLFSLHLCFSVPVQSKTGALEGPEVDGFVKDMMGLVRVRHFAVDATRNHAVKQ